LAIAAISAKHTSSLKS